MLKNIKSWYLQKFKDTTKEPNDPPIMSNIGIAVNLRLLDRIRFLFMGKYHYRLTQREVNYIKHYEKN